MVLPEVSYYSLFDIFKVFLTWFKGQRAELVTSVQFVKAQWDNLQLLFFGDVKIKFDLPVPSAKTKTQPKLN